MGRKNLSQILGILLFGLIGFGVYYFIGYNDSPGQQMQAYVDQLNSETPIVHNRLVTMDSVKLSSNTLLQYFYTLNESMITTEKPPAQVRMEMRPAIIKELIKDPKLEIFRKRGVNFEFYYFDSLQKEIMNFRITPEDYRSM